MLNKTLFVEPVESVSLESTDEKIEKRIDDLMNMDSTKDDSFNIVNWIAAMQYVIEEEKKTNAAGLIALLSEDQLETLIKCMNDGPLADGDVPSKSAVKELIDLQLVVKVVSNGEPGYNACKYEGYQLYKLSGAEKGEEADEKDKE